MNGVELIAETPYLWRSRRPGGRHRLICFPHAGAGAVSFAGWVDLLPEQVELVAIQMPGRQGRIAETPPTSVPALARTLTYAMRPVLDGSFSFFGHSCGASLAFEVARVLQARGAAAPTRLFLSGELPPERAARRPKLYDLPDVEFRAEMVKLGGFDLELAVDGDRLAELLAPVRADFRLWDRHQPLAGPRLTSPITALVGDRDGRVSTQDVEAWRAHTTGGFDVHVYPGGHFYFQADATELMDLVGRTVLADAGVIL